MVLIGRMTLNSGDSPPRTLLRLGLFRDRPVFEAVRQAYSGVVVPAHIAAHSADGLWGFLKGISYPLFFYDPMTYWLLLPARNWTRGSESGSGIDASPPIPDDDIRPAFRRLFQEYGLLEAVTQLDASAYRLQVIERLPSAVLDFQRRGIQPKTQKAVAKYAAILGKELESAGFRPVRLVAPYLAIDSWTGQAYQDQCRLNAGSLSLRQTGEELWAIMAIASAQQLRPARPENRESLGLGQFAGAGLWVGDLDEHTAPVGRLRAYRELIESLGMPVWLMYAGYFGLLLSHFGVVEISHGVFYTESKKLLGPVGSGPPAERYYVPGLHRFYEPVRAFGIIDAIPEFSCSCPECSSIDDLRQEAFATRLDAERRRAWVEKLQRHFLYCRQAEGEKVRTTSLPVLAADLIDRAQRIEALPGAVRAALRLSSSHLTSWAAALG